MKPKGILIILALLLLLVQAAEAMSSANYALDWLIPLTNGGGGRAASDHYTAQYTVGQTAIGKANSTSYGARLGFWQNFVQSWRLWLPFTTK